MPAPRPRPFEGTGAAARRRPRSGDGHGWRRARRLLVVRPDNIGDVIMAGPALRAIRRTLPEATLTLLASPAGAAAAPLVPWIDEVISWRVLWQDLGRLPFEPSRERALVDLLRQRRFDGAVILTSFSQSPHPAAFLAWLAGIPLRAGASREHGGMLTHAPPYGAFERHQAERNLALVEALGFGSGDATLEVRVPSAARDGVRERLAGAGVARDATYLLWIPWASASARTYPPERGAAAMERTARASGLPVVVSAHPRDEARAAALVARIGPATVNLAGRSTIVELAALVERAALVVTNNTVAMHLADALRVPAVVAFSGTDLESQWRPRRTRHVLLRRPTACSPCYAFTCPYGLECLDIPPHEIAGAALGLLAEGAESGAAPARERPDA